MPHFFLRRRSIIAKPCAISRRILAESTICVSTLVCAAIPLPGWNEAPS